MDPLIFISLFILGILFAIVASLVGIGGGLLYTPTLILLYGLTATNATYVSSFIIVFTSLSGTIKYIKQNRVDIKTGFYYLLLAVPGTFIGGYTAEIIDSSLLRRLFAIIIGVYAIRGIYQEYQKDDDDMYIAIHEDDDESTQEEIDERSKEQTQRRIVDEDGHIYEYFVNLKWGYIMAFIAGFLAGLLGIGGGIVLVPLLNVISGLPIHIAVPTSTAMIVVLSFSTVVTRVTTRVIDGTFDINILIDYGVPTALGAIIGAYFGASKIKKFKAKQLTMFFWIVAIFAAIRMFF